MADERNDSQQASQDEQYLKLLKGEISSEEFVKGLKDEARSTVHRGSLRRTNTSAELARPRR